MEKAVYSLQLAVYSIYMGSAMLHSTKFTKQYFKELTRYFSGYEVKFGNVVVAAKLKKHDGTVTVPSWFLGAVWARVWAGFEELITCLSPDRFSGCASLCCSLFQLMYPDLPVSPYSRDSGDRNLQKTLPKSIKSIFLLT